MEHTYESRQQDDGLWFPYIEGKRVGGMRVRGDTVQIPKEGFETQEALVRFMGEFVMPTVVDSDEDVEPES